MRQCLLIFLCASTALFADVLVLTNGQVLETQGAFEVKGSFVVFTDQKGEKVQLPAKLIDLDASRKATEQKAIQDAQAPPTPKKEEVKAPASIADISADLEGRDKDMAQTLSIDQEEIGEYAQENPYNTQEQVQGTAINQTGLRSDNFKEEMASAGQAIGAAEDKVNSLRTQVSNAENNVRNLEIAMDEGTHDNLYETLENSRKNLEKLRADLAQAEKELDKAKKNARSRGVKNPRRAVGKYHKENAKNTEKQN